MRLAPYSSIAGLAVASASLCALAACGSSTDTSASGTQPHTPAIAASPLPSILATTPGSGPAALPTNQPATRGTHAPAAATGRPAGDASSAECAPEALRASVQALAPDLTTGVRQVKVYNCVSGFARLYATPNPAPNGSQPEGDQFFLQFAAGQWHLLVRGAGVDCGDNNPKLAEACAAFDRS